MNNQNEELKLEALKVIQAYKNGDPEVSKAMARMAARILLNCKEQQLVLP